MSYDQFDLFGDDRADRYPNVPGFKRSGTSEQAAAEFESEASRLQRLAFGCLKDEPSTSDEVAAKLGRSVLAIRPRVSELVAKGLVVETSTRRQNASGKWAAVWRVVDHARSEDTPAHPNAV
jgi:predicted ArsR family transcriptional regulator